MEFDFESYKQKIAPALMDLEVVRKDAKKSIVGFVAFLIPMLAIGYYGMSQDIAKEQEIFYIAGVVITFGVAAYFAFRFSKLYRKLREEFKNLVVEKIVSSFNDSEQSLSFNWKSFIPRSTFMASGLFPKFPDEYNGEDHIRGARNDVNFEFSEVDAVEVTEVRRWEEYEEDGETYTREVVEEERRTIFKGIFFKANFNKPIKGSTFVYPDVAEKLLGNFLGNLVQKYNFPQSGKLVKLENVEFEKEFAVYGTDQIESRFVLTPLIMEKILKLKSQLDTKMYLSFLDNNVYVAVDYRKSLFEPKLLGEIASTEDIQVMHQCISFFISIIDELNLEERLWDKKSTIKETA